MVTSASSGKRVFKWIVVLFIIAAIIVVAYVFIKKYRARQLCNSIVEVLLFEKQIVTSFSQVPPGTALKDANLKVDAGAVLTQLPNFKQDAEQCYGVVISSCNMQEIIAREKYANCFKNIFEKISPMKQALDATTICKQYGLHDVQSQCYQQTDQYIKAFQKKYQIKFTPPQQTAQPSSQMHTVTPLTDAQKKALQQKLQQLKKPQTDKKPAAKTTNQ